MLRLSRSAQTQAWRQAAAAVRAMTTARSTRLFRRVAFMNTGHRLGCSASMATALHRQHRRAFSGNLPEHEVVGMPALSPSVERSKIVEWKKNEGDFVEADEAIAVVETDKAQLDWKVVDDVYLAKILLPAGEEVDVGTPVCVWVEEEKDVGAFKNFAPGAGGAAPAASQQPAPAAAPAAPAASAAPSGSAGPPPGLPEHEVHGMPALSPTATEGAVAEWLVNEGDFVEEGTEIAQIQTDKSVVAWQAIDEGYLALKLLAAAPDNPVPVNTPIAVFVQEEKDVAAFKGLDPQLFLGGGGAAPNAPAEQTPAAAAPAASPDAPAPAAAAQPVSYASVRDPNERISASPYAKKLARDMGVPLHAIAEGSGARGRITAADVEKAAKSAPAAAPAKAAPPAAPLAPPPGPAGSDRSFADEPMSTMRQIIAKRLSESKFTSPHYYETIEFEIDRLLKMRQEMNEDGEVKISVNDFIIKASAQALRDVPAVNVSLINDGKAVRKYNYVDVSVAVATPAGLITPIVSDADLRGLRSISLAMKELAGRAKENRLAPEEFQGGTFTISNLGMFGVKSFTAIINPPQACILAVGGSSEVLKPDATSEKGFRVATTMQVTLSSDHRVVDGAVAAQFLAAFRKYMENPAKLML